MYRPLACSGRPDAICWSCCELADGGGIQPVQAGYQMGYMVIRGEEVRRIFLDEIAVVILESPAYSFAFCGQGDRSIYENRVVTWVLYAAS